MKKLFKKGAAFALAFAGLLAVSAQGQTVLLSESFETDGEGTRYTTVGAFANSDEDHWGRTDGTWDGTNDINTYQGPGGYSNVDGSWFWAGEDLDDNGGSLPLSVTFNSFNISGFTSSDDFTFSGLFGYAGVVNNDWDAGDYLHIQYSVDGGSWTDVLNFESTAGGSNSDMGWDANFDGQADDAGETVLTYELASFSYTTSGISGTNMEVRAIAAANSGDEAFAFDNIQVSAVPEPSSALLILLGMAGLTFFRRRR